MLKSKKEIKTKYEDRKEKSNKWSGVAELKSGDACRGKKEDDEIGEGEGGG